MPRKDSIDGTGHCRRLRDGSDLGYPRRLERRLDVVEESETSTLFLREDTGQVRFRLFQINLLKRVRNPDPPRLSEVHVNHPQTMEGVGEGRNSDRFLGVDGRPRTCSRRRLLGSSRLRPTVYFHQGSRTVGCPGRLRSFTRKER